MSIRVAAEECVSPPDHIAGDVNPDWGLWQTCRVTTASETIWLTVPDLVEILGSSPSRVRRLIEDRALLGSRIDGVLKVPASFIRDGEPLSELRGTLVLMADNHYSDEESMRWLLNTDDSLGVSPIDALLAGRKAEVRRVAQALAF